MSANLSVECVYLTLAALVVSAGIAVDWCDTVTIKTDEGLRSVAVTSSRNGLVIVHLGGVR